MTFSKLTPKGITAKAHIEHTLYYSRKLVLTSTGGMGVLASGLLAARSKTSVTELAVAACCATSSFCSSSGTWAKRQWGCALTAKRQEVEKLHPYCERHLYLIIQPCLRTVEQSCPWAKLQAYLSWQRLSSLRICGVSSRLDGGNQCKRKRTASSITTTGVTAGGSPFHRA